MQFCSLDQVFLQCIPQLYEVCAVSGNTNEHVTVTVGILLGSSHGVCAHDVELHVHRVVGQIAVHEA